MLVTPRSRILAWTAAPRATTSVGIQFRVRLAIEEFLNGAANERGARRAADENDFLDVDWFELGVGEGLFHWAHAFDLTIGLIHRSNPARVNACSKTRPLGRSNRKRTSSLPESSCLAKIAAFRSP